MKNHDGKQFRREKTNSPRRTERSYSDKPSTVDLILSNLDRDDFTPSVFDAVIRFWVSNGQYDLPAINAGDYADYASFCRDYWLLGLLKKFEKFPGSDRLRCENASKSFERAQMQCFGTNCSIRARGHLGHDLGGISSGSVFERARQIVQTILGPLDSTARETILSLCNHGPGSTPRIPRKQACPAVKFSGIPEITQGCLAFFGEDLYKVAPRWLTDVLVVPCSKQSTVPKNAKTYRLISSEPDINMFVQKGIGAYLKRRLRHKATVGPMDIIRHCNIGATLDLFDQSNNQKMARLASLGPILGQHYATVDLSMASDTLSYELVRYLLPSDWFDPLNHARTGSTKLIDGTVVRLEMFSQMGNGNTFELESMIFYALVRALLELRGIRSTSLVFGDDIITTSAIIHDGSLPLLFALAGFNINKEKTFWEGKFRESCGSHFFLGDEVKPMYITDQLNSVTDKLIVANNLRRWSVGWGSRWIRDRCILNAYKAIVITLPKRLQTPRIADGYGDGALVGQFHEVCPVRKYRADYHQPELPGFRKANGKPRRGPRVFGLINHGHEGWSCETTVPVTKSDIYDDAGVLLAALWKLEGLRKPSGIVRLNVPPYESIEEPRSACEGRPKQIGYRWIEITCMQFPRV